MAKPKALQVDSLNYVIMLAFGKSRPQDFRKNILEFKRKNREVIWKGDFDSDVIEAVRLAPSACNTQPWRIFSNNNCIKVYRNTKIKSFISAGKLSYYNSIDMGICLCLLEIALIQKGYKFDRTLITYGRKIPLRTFENCDIHNKQIYVIGTVPMIQSP